MSEEVHRSVEESILDCIYVAMLDANDRLGKGTANLRRCLNYLEGKHGYRPPAKHQSNYPIGTKEPEHTKKKIV